MSEIKKNKMSEILMRDNSQIREDRANRIGLDLKEAHVGIILAKRAELRRLEAQKAAMTDLSASNSTFEDNAIKDIDANEFTSKYQKLCETIANKSLLYEISLKIGTELYDIDVEKI